MMFWLHSEWSVARRRTIQQPDLAEEERYLLSLMMHDATGIDELVFLTSWSTQKILSVLGAMEAKGIVGKQAGGYIARSEFLAS